MDGVTEKTGIFAFSLWILFQRGNLAKQMAG
jgi:hypothetical protein